MAFKGHVEHSLDAKNRLSIPARYRTAFASGIVLAKDSDACFSAWTPEAQEEIIELALQGKNPLGSEYKSVQRFFQSNSFEAELDSAGRVVVPPPLLEHADIEKEVVVAGVGNHLEVWNSERWREEQRALEDRIREMTEALGDPS